MLRADATAAGLIHMRLLDGEEWVETRVAYQVLGRIVPQNRSLIAKLNYIVDF